MIKYNINLVKNLRDAEKKHRKHYTFLVILIVMSVCVLALAFAHTGFQIIKMRAAIHAEQAEIARLQNELRQYETTRESIDKSDIQLLNDLLSRRIYWTRILDAMARHLPDEQPTSYWITRFEYRDQPMLFTVHGLGYITDRQEQLLEIDMYLQRLRADKNWSEVFQTTYLGPVRRSDEEVNRTLTERVSFEYSAVRKGGRRR